MAAADSTTEGDRGGNMVIATTIKATAAIAEIVRRIMGSLRFPSHKSAGGSAARFKAALLLEPHAGFGERHRGRLLQQILKDTRGSDGNDSGDKAGPGSDECTLRVSRY
jgi:hypothetical protein